MDVEEQAHAISTFGNKVFHGLYKENSVAVSPIALGMALMAATCGAEGDTKKELLETFQISTLDLESCQSLIKYVSYKHLQSQINMYLYYFIRAYLKVNILLIITEAQLKVTTCLILLHLCGLINHMI